MRPVLSIDDVRTIVHARLRRVLAARGELRTHAIDDASIAFGRPAALLDSLGWVVFCTAVEDDIAEQLGHPGVRSSLLDEDASEQEMTIGRIIAYYAGAMGTER